MSITTFIIIALASVGVMTLFSSLWSHLANKQFREPNLLAEILTKDPISPPEEASQKAMGWTIHITLGLCFVFIYEILWESLDVQRNIFWALLFGICMGMVGIAGWWLLFRLKSYSANFDYKQFYIHIFFAHIIFSLTALLVFNVMVLLA